MAQVNTSISWIIATICKISDIEMSFGIDININVQKIILKNCWRQFMISIRFIGIIKFIVSNYIYIMIFRNRYTWLFPLSITHRINMFMILSLDDINSIYIFHHHIHKYSIDYSQTRLHSSSVTIPGLDFQISHLRTSIWAIYLKIEHLCYDHQIIMLIRVPR